MLELLALVVRVVAVTYTLAVSVAFVALAGYTPVLAHRLAGAYPTAVAFVVHTVLAQDRPGRLGAADAQDHLQR